jgi:hypothetical protein
MSIDLLIYFGRVPTEHIRAALDAAWSWPHVVGPYGNKDFTPGEQKVAIGELNLDETWMCWGAATLPNGKPGSFTSYVVPDDRGTWLYLGLTMETLERAYQTDGYPFGGSATEPWAKEVFAFLFDLACWIHPRASFNRAMIGFLMVMDTDELANDSFPERRYHGYMREDGGKLKYFAPNVDQPLITTDRRIS